MGYGVSSAAGRRGADEFLPQVLAALRPRPAIMPAKEGSKVCAIDTSAHTLRMGGAIAPACSDHGNTVPGQIPEGDNPYGCLAGLR
jgi:hypothetical protein